MIHCVACTSTVCFPRLRFTGKERDAESGLDYFRARYYAISMGSGCRRTGRSARNNTGDETGAAGQLLGAWEAVHVAYLQPDPRRKDLADAGNGAQQSDLGRGLEDGGDALLDAFDLNLEWIGEVSCTRIMAAGRAWRRWGRGPQRRTGRRCR